MSTRKHLSLWLLRLNAYGFASVHRHLPHCFTVGIIITVFVIGRYPHPQARINSVKLQMENQLALVKVTGELERSTEVMVAMQRLIKIPEIQAAMLTMSKEMTKVLVCIFAWARFWLGLRLLAPASACPRVCLRACEPVSVHATACLSTFVCDYAQCLFTSVVSHVFYGLGVKQLA